MPSEVFHDFDAFADSVSGADFGMLLQNPRRPVWALGRVDLGGAHVQFGREGSGNITEGRSRSDGYLLFAPCTNAAAHAANGVALDESSVAILEPGVDFCLRSKVEHDWCSVFIPTDQLTRHRGRGRSWSDFERAACRVVRTDRHLADRFRQSVRQVFAVAGSCPQFETSAAATSAAENLLNLTCLILGQRPRTQSRHEGRPRYSRMQIIRRSQQMLEERKGKPIRLGDLAGHSEVSERTLRTVFNEYYGIGPVRYVQLRQLRLIRHALLAADPENVSVSDVLVAHGEWEFSRFASRYRQLYGELPSDTLRKSR